MRLTSCFLLATVAGGLAACGAVHTWTGPANGLWNTSGNWSPIGVPPSSTTTTLIFNPAAAQTIQNDIPGTLTLNSLTVAGGSGQVVLTGNPLNFSGSTPLVDISRTGGASINLPLQPGSALRLRNTSPNDLLLRGIISGASGVVVETGLAQLAPVSGPNTFSGGLTVKASGRLRVNGSQFHSGLGTSGMVVEDTGSVEIFGSGTIAGPATTITGYGDGRGALFSSTISFPSVTYGGTLSLGGNARVAALEYFFRHFILSGGVNLNGHRLEIGTGLQANRDAVVESQGVISGTGEILVTGGTLRFPASSPSANTFKAAIRVGALGTVALSPADDAKLGTATNELILDGGALLALANGAFANSRKIVLGPNGGTIRSLTPNNVAVSVPAVLSGPGGLIIGDPAAMPGSLSVELSPNQTYLGGTWLRAGEAVIGDDSALGAVGTAVNLEGAGGRLLLANEMTLSAGRRINALTSGGTVAVATNATIAASLFGPGWIALAPGSSHTNIAVTLTGTNHAQSLRFGGLRLRVPSVGVLGGPDNGMEIQPFGVLEFLSSMTVAASGGITNGGVIDTGPHEIEIARPIWFDRGHLGRGSAKEGTGTLVLAATNSQIDFGNKLTVRKGRVQLDSPHALPAGMTVTLEADTTFGLGGQSGNYIFSGQGSVELQGATWTNSFGFPHLQGNIIGPGSLAVMINGMDLLGDNSHTNTVIGEGVAVHPASDGSLGTPESSVWMMQNSTLLGPGHISENRTIVLFGDATLHAGYSTGDSLSVDATIAGIGDLNLFGRMRLGSANSTFRGNIIATDPATVLELKSDGGLGYATNSLSLSTAEQFGDIANLVAAGDIHMPASRSIKLGGYGLRIDTQGFNVRIDGRMTPTSATAGLQKRGSGRLTINGTNSYPGFTDIFEGTLAGSGKLPNVRMESGADFSPGNDGIGKFRTGFFIWHTEFPTGPNGRFYFDLGRNGQCDQLELSASLEGDSSSFGYRRFVFSGTPEVGIYLLVKPVSGIFQTTLTAEDFSHSGLDGLVGFFSIDATGLKFTVTTAPNPDSDNDGLPDSWEQTYFSGLQAGANGDQDNDGHPNLEEYMAGTIPTNSVSFLQMRLSSAPPSLGLIFSPVLAERSYGVVGRSNVPSANWFPIGGVSVINSGNERELRFPAPATNTFYRLLIAEP